MPLYDARANEKTTSHRAKIYSHTDKPLFDPIKLLSGKCRPGKIKVCSGFTTETPSISPLFCAVDS